jgi:glycosylphosphatidylinositol transamidase (GPIT) subunit GPI8
LLPSSLGNSQSHFSSSSLHSRVLDNLKDYSIKALRNAVDHLGMVTFKLNDLISLQNKEVGYCRLVASVVAQVPILS